MADPRFTVATLANYLRGQVPDTTGTDQELVDRWMATHPEDRRLLEHTAPQKKGGLLASTIITGARIVPSMIGATIGAGMGAPAGGIGAVPGMAAGGAAGGAVGELIAQGLETFLGRRSKFNPASLAAETALGAIPVSKLRGASRAAQIAGEGAKGFAMGAGSSALLAKAEGREIDPMATFLSGGLGATIGTIGGTFAAKSAQKSIPTHSFDEYGNIIEGREAELLRGDKLDGDGIWSSAKRRFVDRVAPARSFVEDLAESKGIKLARGESPGEKSDIALGGVSAEFTRQNEKLDDLVFRMDNDDRAMRADVTMLLDYRGFKHGAKTLEERFQRLFSEAESASSEKLAKLLREEAEELQRKLKAGEALPEGLTPKDVQQRLLALEAAFKKDPDRWARVVGYADEVHRFNKESLEVMLKSGFIDQKFFDIFEARASEFSKKRQHVPGADWSRPGGWSKDVDDVAVGYVPLLRFMDAMRGSTRRGVGKRGTPLEPLRGSERLTIDPIDASRLRLRSVLLAAADNNSKRAFIDFRDLNADFEKSIVKAVGKNPVAPEGMSPVSVWKNGKQESYFLPDEVAAVLNNLDDGSTSLLGELGVNFLTKLTQRSATSLNLGFSITNVLRDISDVALLRGVVKSPTEYPAFALEWARTFAQLGRKELQQGLRSLVSILPQPVRQGLGKLDVVRNVREAKGYVDFVRTGAAGSTMQRQLNPGQRIFGEELTAGGLADKVLATADVALAPVAKISNLLEETTKLASFNRLTKKGITGNERAIMTRRYGGSPDFGVRGADSRRVGNMILFFNAQMQGITRNFRAIKDIGKDLRTKGGAASVMGTMIPAAGLEMWRIKHNAQYVDPDGTLAMDRITDADRENYWTWVTDDLEEVEGVVRHKTIKFSKGHLARILFNPMSDVMESALSQRKNWSPTETTLNLVEQFSPGSMKIDPEDPVNTFVNGLIASSTPWVKAPVEILMNTRTYSNVPLESRRARTLQPQFRTTDYTSPTMAKAVQAFAALTGTDKVSPIQAQSVISNILPGPGDQALAFLDAFIGGEGVTKATGAATIEPVTRRFKGSPGDQVRRDQSNKFYRALNRAQQAHRTANDLRMNQPSKYQAFVNKNANRLRYRKALEQISGELADARKYPPAQGEPYINQRLALAERLIDEMNQAE